jgi:uncharacterized membrane protein
MHPTDFAETAAEARAGSQPEYDAFAMERAILFSDAIYAIIITLLALDVRLPENESGASLAQLLVDTMPKLASYALSFLVVAMLWRVHLRRFRYFVALDSALLSGNVLQLMLTGLLPFSTSVLKSHLGALGVTIYAGNIVAISVVGWITYFVARRKPGLVSPQLTAQINRRDDLRTLIVVAVFGLSIAIAWWNANWAAFSWLLMLPGNRLLSVYERRLQAGR